MFKLVHVRNEKDVFKSNVLYHIRSLTASTYWNEEDHRYCAPRNKNWGSNGANGRACENLWHNPK